MKWVRPRDWSKTKPVLRHTVKVRRRTRKRQGEVLQQHKIVPLVSSVLDIVVVVVCVYREIRREVFVLNYRGVISREPWSDL